MAWERKIPFGYRMDNGTIACEMNEAEAVKRIFSLYLNGSSLNRITEEMMHRGLRYHQEKLSWNKSMVKRILENRHYLGDEMYPGIISEETFNRVQSMKQQKNVYAPCPIRIAAMQDKLACELCGSAVKRIPAGQGKAYWKCRNPECDNSVRLHDDELGDKLEKCLRSVAVLPDVRTLQLPSPQRRLKALRTENELNSAFNRSEEHREYLRSLIYTLAAEKYMDLPDDTPAYITSRICREAENGSWEALRKLLDTAVSTVSIGRSRILALRLKNGLIVTEKGEVREA